MNLLPHKILKTLLALCLATPLLAFSSVIFPYTVPKVFAFRILVEIAAVFYLYLVLKYLVSFLPTSLFCYSGRPSVIPAQAGIQASYKKSGCRIKSGMTISIAVLIFLFFSFLSALFGADFSASFWGNLERGGGVFSLLHFVAFFFMLVSVFGIDGSKSSVPTGSGPARHASWLASVAGAGDFFHQLIKISVFASALISLLAIFQHFFSLGNLLPQVDRVYSLIGNAGILGSYLIFNIFLAGYLALSESVILSSAKVGRPLRRVEDEARRIYFSLYSLFIILNSFALLLSGTRGAWLGLLAGIVIFLILIAWQSQQKKQRKIAVWSLAIIFILATSLFLIRNSSFAQNNSILSRLTSISLTDSTLQSRLILWQGAWQSWQSKPLLGWGSENFEMATESYLSPQLANFEAYSTDRAHNFIFDYGVTLGWLGLLSYLVIFGAAFWQLIKNLKNNLIFSSIFISLLAAYLVQNLFIFDSFISYLMLFFVLALINNACHPDPAVAGEGSTSFLKKLVFIIFVFFILYSLFSFNLKPLLSANYANQILSLPAIEATQTTPSLKNVLALNSFASPEITYQVVLDYLDKISQNPALAQNEEFYNVASAELLKIIACSPNQSRNYVALSWLNLYFSSQEKSRIDQSLQLAQKVRELSPNKKDAYLLLVAGYSLLGQSQKALEAVDQALAIDAKMGEEVKAYFEILK